MARMFQMLGSCSRQSHEDLQVQGEAMETRKLRTMQPVAARFLLFTYLQFLLFFPVPLCWAANTMKIGDQIVDGDSLLSTRQVFEFGFFSFGSNPRRYVGIWYSADRRTIVWVANGGQPLSDGTGVLRLAVDGNLVLSSQQSQSLWSTNLDRMFNREINRTVQLLDSGNLVLTDNTTKVLWQSFDHPTDTFLPGMNITEGFRLTSWKGPNDPAPGNFTFQKQENQYVIQSTSNMFWKSGILENFARKSNDVPPAMSSLLLDSNSTDLQSNTSALARAKICSNGTIQYFTWVNETASWNLSWFEPRDLCHRWKYCGDWGVCNSEDRIMCRCLPGFQPQQRENWKWGVFSEGCVRESPLGGTNTPRNFLNLKMMNFGKQDGKVNEDVEEESQCRDRCLDNNKCEAYSYIKNQYASTDEHVGGTCWVWLEKLNNIQENLEDGYDLNVRVALSEANIKCGTCGSNTIPYPLSIAKGCGDPSYSGFWCNTSSGQVYVGSHLNPYRVTDINEEAHKFTIQSKTTTDCERSGYLVESILNLKLSSSFNISYCTPTQGEQSKNIEIEWKLPKEPLCSSPKDCTDWMHTSCKEAGNGTKRCLCKPNFRWNSSMAFCASGPRHLKLQYLISLTAIPILIVPICYLLYRWTKSTVQENRKSTPENLAIQLHNSQRRIKEWINSDQLGEEDTTSINVPFLDMAVILEATGNFSDENKLGQGGFGPVYKGIFPGGEEIAVKRLSNNSGQGFQEFKNEVLLIAKLQHRNLVRLLGYCIEGEEKILLYEYMPNKSLDSFLFDRTRCVLLTWEIRQEIILGIARGMLYLHQDSRLRIIHRDLKTGNVLLDAEMNPKISDFGLARIFMGKQTEASTNRVMGTYGYMSPEYALDGFFSVKSDVFSFGVVILEIISGKRNTGFYNSDGPLNLISYAWMLWKANNTINLIDHAIEATCNASEALKCINLALLCVQHDPSDRPTMSSIVFTLSNENVTLPTPKRPAFVIETSLTGEASSLSKPGTSVEVMPSLEQSWSSSTDT